MQAQPPPLPLGRSGTLEAVGLSGAAGHAVVIREADRARVLLSTDAAGGEERLVVVPLDAEVEVRVDGDALAVWLADAMGGRPAPERLPGWASASGLALMLLVVGLALLGSFTFFSWLFGALGVGG
jgi:hypothetical protein